MMTCIGIDLETATLFIVGHFNQIARGALLLISDVPTTPDGVKTEESPNNCWSPTMTLNPIEEIKRTRHQLGADADFDVHRVFFELRELQASSSRSYVHLAPRRVMNDDAIHSSSDAGRSEVE